jgi:hypothetical protein
MLEAAGICPAWIYAYKNTGGLRPRPDGRSLLNVTRLNGAR